MNISYFRKSKYSLEKTILNFNKIIKEQNWKMLGDVDLPDKMGKMILICRPEWVKTVIKNDYNLLGFLPCSISIFEKDNQVLIGTGQPAVIKAVAQNKEIIDLAIKAEGMIKELVNYAAGVKELKPTNVRLYSTMSCPYCKMEKSWLESNNIKHDVVYVDLNQNEAKKMVEKTGQMGVPVTEIMYDEGEPEYIIGFDKPHLSESLGVK